MSAAFFVLNLLRFPIERSRFDQNSRSRGHHIGPQPNRACLATQLLEAGGPRGCRQCTQPTTLKRRTKQVRNRAGSIAHRPVVVQRIVWWHPAHGVKGSIGTHPVCRGWHLGDPCDCTGSPIWFILLICAANHVRQARPLRSGRLQGAQVVSDQLCYGALSAEMVRGS